MPQLEIRQDSQMSNKNKKIEVQGSTVTIISTKEQDYISLTDMVRNIDNGIALYRKMVEKQKYH